MAARGEMTSTSRGKCPQCGRVIPADAPGAVCPVCALRESLGAIEPPSPSDSTRYGPLVSDLFEGDPTQHSQEAVIVHEVPCRYTELGEEGRGGMGRVLLVRDEALGRNVVLKELLPPGADSEDPRRQQRFLREAQITGRLEHPAILPVYEVGRRPDGTPYYTMKRVRGRTLAAALAAAASLPERLALLPNFVDLCHALAYAHEHGVIHRDLKPSNIMIGAFGETIILDWGLAKSIGDSDGDDAAKSSESIGNPRIGSPGGSDTVTGEVFGSPVYMAPEQASGMAFAADHRADVYSLGVILYQILTGSLPYPRTSIDEYIKKVLADEPPPVRQVCPDVPGALAAVAEKAMKKQPGRRYQSAAEMANDIARYQTGALVSAHAYTWRERLRHFLWKYRIALSIAALIVLTGGLSAALGLAAVIREKARTEREFYRASINVAQNAVDNARYGEAREALFGAPQKYRNWEWGWLLNNANPNVIVLRGHAERVRSAAFSPDGSRIVTAGDDGSVRIWDAGSGLALYTLEIDPEGSVEKAVFTRDGERLITSAGNVTEVWTFQSPRPALSFEGHAPSLSSDGNIIAVASALGNWASIHDAATGEETQRLVGHSDVILDIAISPDGQTVATAGNDHSAILWDIRAGSIRHKLTGHTDSVRGVRFSADGSLLVTAGDDHSARIWDVASGQEIALLHGHGNYVLAAAFSHDGKHVLTASEDRTIRVWDAKTGRQIQDLEGFARPPRFFALSPDDSCLVTEGEPGEAVLRRVASQDRFNSLPGHSAPVAAVAFSPDGLMLATGDGESAESEGPKLILWDVPTARPLRELELEHPISALEFFPNAPLLGVADTSGNFLICDPADGRVRETWKGHDDRINAMALAPDGNHIVTASTGGVAAVRDARTGRERFRLEGHAAQVESVDYSHDGKRIATGGRDATVRIWDARDGAPVRVIDVGGDRVHCLAFSPSAPLLATGDREGGVRVWDARSGELVTSFAGFAAATERVEALAFSPDGTRLATGAEDGSVRIWDTATGRELLLLSEHTDRVVKVGFSRDGHFLVTGAHPHTVFLWKALPWRNMRLE